MTGAAQMVETALAAAGIAPAVIGTISLALDEILTNIVAHEPASAQVVRQIGLALTLDGCLLVAEVADDGPAFDPLSLPAPDLESPLEKRPIGGLGVHLVRSLMDEVRYRRDGDRNRLTLVKRVVAGAGGQGPGL